MKRSLLGNPSKWHFDIDAYLNPYLPSPPWKRLPRFVAHFFGHRSRPQQPIGNLAMIAWAFIGIFGSLSIIEVVGRNVESFRTQQVPLIVGSFGAAAILEFYAIESPLSQPRNAILGQVLASLVGVSMAKLFELSPTLFPAPGSPTSGVPAHDMVWLAAALACASAAAIMALTGTVHPPAGATALLAVAEPNVRNLGWFLIPVMLLGSTLMLGVALLVNNLQRRFPVYWWAAGEVGGWWRSRKEGGQDGKQHWGPHIETKSWHASSSSSSSPDPNPGDGNNRDLESGRENASGAAPPPEATTGDSRSMLDMETMPGRRRDLYIPRGRSIVIEADRVVMPDNIYMTPEERMFLEELCGRFWDIASKAQSGRTLPLAQLNAEHVAETGRPMRIAVDTPLAVFMCNGATEDLDQEGYGGMNHAARTLFFHIRRILEAGVQPVFVFDGAGKPERKRGTHTKPPLPYRPYDPPRATALRTREDIAREKDVGHIVHLAKKFLDFLGLPWIDAPAEAEAECAALEKRGLVDAVMSADGDAFLFGAQTVLKFAGTATKGKGRVTNVQVFQMDELKKANPPLTQRVIFSLALFAGGDYHSGLRDCGPELALKIGATNLGYHLYSLTQNGLWDQLTGWRGRLAEALETNRFGGRHTRAAASLGHNSFPDLKVLEYYRSEMWRDPTTTVVDWSQEADIKGLRQFTREYFDWKHRYFAVKFVRVTAVVLLVRTLLRCVSLSSSSGEEDGPGRVIRIVKSRGEGATKETQVKFDRGHIVVGVDVSAEHVVAEYQGNLRQLEVKDEPEWLPAWLVSQAYEACPALFQQQQSEISSGTTTKRPRGRPPKNLMATNTGPPAAPKHPRGQSPKTPAGTPKRARGRPPLKSITANLGATRTAPQTPTPASAFSIPKSTGAKTTRATESPLATSARNPHYSLGELRREFIDLTEDD